MSHIDVMPIALEVPSQMDVPLPFDRGIEAEPTGAFGRGIACGLAIAVSFWTLVAIELVAR